MSKIQKHPWSRGVVTSQEVVSKFQYKLTSYPHVALRWRRAWRYRRTCKWNMRLHRGQRWTKPCCLALMKRTNHGPKSSMLQYSTLAPSWTILDAFAWDKLKHSGMARNCIKREGTSKQELETVEWNDKHNAVVAKPLHLTRVLCMHRVHEMMWDAAQCRTKNTWLFELLSLSLSLLSLSLQHHQFMSLL